MSIDQQTQNRQRLVKLLADKINAANPEQISNNDIRRLVDRFVHVINYLRWLEKYPRDFTLINPNHVIRPDHCASLVLDRYAVHTERVTLLSPILVKQTTEHLRQCTACRARLDYYESLLMAGLRVQPGDPNRTARRLVDDVEKVGRSMDSVPSGMGVSFLNEDGSSRTS